MRMGITRLLCRLCRWRILTALIVVVTLCSIYYQTQWWSSTQNSEYDHKLHEMSLGDRMRHMKRNKAWRYFELNRKASHSRSVTEAAVSANRTEFATSNILSEADHFIKLTTGTVDTNEKPAKYQRIPLTSFELYKTANYEAGPDSMYAINYSNVVQSSIKRKTPLEVFFVKHSHIDPGWLETVDGYYDSKVEQILNNMVKYLTQHHNMTFIWSETVYFSRWWQTLDSLQKNMVRKLLANGQLEMVTGGWVMPDEACTHFYALIDQLIEGHQWLYHNLKVKPRHNWSVDPFGYSSTAAYLWKLAGFDLMVIQRIHHAIKNLLVLGQNLQFSWRQQWDSLGVTDMLTYTDPWIYYTTGDSCGPRKDVCQTIDVVYNREIVEQLEPKDNVRRMAVTLHSQLVQKSLLYKHNVILVMIGNDFEGDESDVWESQYTAYSKIFNYLNKRSKYNIAIRFGTVNDYYSALKRHAHNLPNMGFGYFEGDFFPYSLEVGEQWTGYFTTKPNSKRLCRDLQEHIRAASILNAFARSLGEKNTENSISLKKARQELAVFQHHDAITGTSKQFVSEDYDKRLTNALEIAKNVIHINIASLRGIHFSENIQRESQNIHVLKPRVWVNLNNISEACLIIFNPLPHSRREIITLSSRHTYLNVLVDKTILNTQTIKYKSKFINMVDIIFIAELPPFAIKEFTVQYVEGSRPEKYTSFVKRKASTKPVTMSNACYFLKFNEYSGLLESVFLKQHNLTIMVKLQFEMFTTDQSGLYVMKLGILNNPAAKGFKVHTLEGDIVSSVTVNTEIYHHKISIFHTESTDGCGGIHIDNLVKLERSKDIEFVMRLHTDIYNGDKFFVDSNGFQIVERRRIKELSNAFYPMTSMAYIENREARISLHSRQSLAVSSLESGNLEVLLDRNVDMDDNKGAGEGVTNNPPAASAFILQIERKTGNINNDPCPSLDSIQLNSRFLAPVLPVCYENCNMTQSLYTSLRNNIPCDIEIINIRDLNIDGEFSTIGITLRRWCYDGSNFPIPTNCGLNKPVTMCELFPRCPTRIKEMSLSFIHEYASLDPREPVDITPMQIKSYAIWGL